MSYTYYNIEQAIIKQYEKGFFYSLSGHNCYIHKNLEHKKFGLRCSPCYPPVLKRMVQKKILKLKNNIYEIHNDK